MHRTLVTLACVLTLASGSALAQQQQGSSTGSQTGNNAQGPTLTEKVKETAKAIGDKTKEVAGKVKDKAGAVAQDARSSSPEIAQMQQRADDNHKAAKAKCDAIEQRAQKNLCEKQATAAHASAEVNIAKAEVAAQGGKTSAMGAGKSKQ